MHLLVVEDDPVVGKSLRKGLEEARHECVWVKDGEAGLAEALTQRFDAIVLDLLLPGVPGLACARRCGRRTGRLTPGRSPSHCFTRSQPTGADSSYRTFLRAAVG